MTTNLYIASYIYSFLSFPDNNSNNVLNVNFQLAIVTLEEITADVQNNCLLSHAVSSSFDHNGGVATSENVDLK